MQDRQDYIKSLIDKHGAEKLVFLALVRPVRSGPFGLLSYTSGNDPEILMPCCIDAAEEWRDRGSRGMKIKLLCMVEGYSNPRFYQSDLSSMVQDPDRPYEVLIRTEKPER